MLQQSPVSRSRQQWERVLRSRGIRPTRSMGQNFLVEPEVARDVVAAAGVQAGDLVVEIGPGLGMLTRELLAAGARVIAVELDRELKAFLDEDLPTGAGLRVIERDALHLEVGPLVNGEPYAVVANLPYSSGTAIVRRFLTLEHPPGTITVMLQREVAERMAAVPPGMSLLTLAVQVYATASIAFLVPPDVFVPAPKVESAVVRLERRERPLVEEDVRERMFELATHAFQRKRKTLGNGLAQGLNRPKAEVEDRLRDTGIDPTRRPETVSIAEWIALAGAFANEG